MNRRNTLALASLLLGTLRACYDSGADSDGAAGFAGQAGSTAQAGSPAAGSAGDDSGNGGEGGSAEGGETNAAGESGSGPAGAGGEGGTVPCEASALILIQRSGAMVESVEPGSGGANWWGLLEPALIDAGGIVPSYGDEIALGVGTFHLLASDAVCPTVNSTPLTSNATLIEDFLQNAQLEALQAVTNAVKSDGPVALAVEQAATLLGAASGKKYLVLIVFGYPDTCAGPQDYAECYVDETLAAVQAARAAGVTTIPIVLRGPVYDGLLGAPIYQWYAQALANAGAGLPLGPLPTELTPTLRCMAPDAVLDGDYSGAAAAAPSYFVPQSGPVADGPALAAALDAIFARVAACQ